MKYLLTILLISTLLISCKEDSSITPLATAKKLSERFGTQSKGSKIVTIPIKIPMTQSTLSRYSADDILNPTDNAEIAGLPENQIGYLDRVRTAFKLELYNLGLRLGVQNRYRYTTNYDGFPEIDTDYIKSVKIKKLFFAIEPCDPNDPTCKVADVESPSSLFFLEKFFLNISTIQKPEDLAFLDIPQPESLSPEKFKNYVDRAWGKQPTDFLDYLNKDTGEIDNNLFYDLNVAKLDNKENIKKARKLRRRNNLRDSGKNFIARIDTNSILETKKFFKRNAFKKSVKDLTFLGKSLFIELYSEKDRELFFKTITEQKESIRDIGVYEIEGCTILTCTDVKVNPINLVPMLKKSTNIKFDTYFSVNNLDPNDFRYSGYLEIEIKIELPL